MGYIDKIRYRGRTGSVGRSSGRGVSGAVKELPLDHQLTFKRDANEQWSFRDDRIFINDIDVEEVIGYESRDVRLWCGVSEALMEYKDEVMRRNGKYKAKFFAKVSAVQDRVVGNMKKLYDEKTDGLYLSLGDGEVLVNNFNVRAFLAMYHMRPTSKARQFLMGLKSKLALILVNRNGTPQYERVHRVIRQLYEEVLGALDIPPLEVRRLPSPDRNKSL